MSDFMDVVLPELDTIELRDRKKKEKYTVDLFIPGSVGLLLMDKMNDLQDVYLGKPNKKNLKTMYRIFELVLKRQYEFMTQRWCEENIDTKEALVLLTAIANPILEYVKITGIEAMPLSAKKPEDTGKVTSLDTPPNITGGQ